MRSTIFAAAVFLLMTIPHTAAATPSETETVWGTGFYEFTGAFSFGLSVCTTSGSTGTELDCGSDLTSRGTGDFDVSSWSPSSGAYRHFDVKAQLNGLRPDPLTGYILTICSDVDDDGVCTNVGANFDVFADAYSNAAGKATLSACFPVDLDGSYDDLAIFIGTWVNSGAFGGSPGAGTSEGAYQVELYPGAYTSSC